MTTIMERGNHSPMFTSVMAEVLLNYAEACLGLGQEDLARDAIDQVRERAGMPDVPPTETGAALLGPLQERAPGGTGMGGPQVL